jgi:hypothetical protein
MTGSPYFRYNRCSVGNLEFEQQTTNRITLTKGAPLDMKITEGKINFQIHSARLTLCDLKTSKNRRIISN